MMKIQILIVVVLSVLGCSPIQPPIESNELPPGRPMLLSISDGSSYPATASIEVWPNDDGSPQFVLQLTIEAPAGEMPPSIQAPIAPSDVLELIGGMHGEGTAVPYGTGQAFTYFVDGVEVFRTPRTIRLTLSDATVSIDIEMGELIAIGTPPSGLGGAASASLVGHLAVGCSVPSPVGEHFTMSDLSWSSDFCQGVRSTYGLDELIDL
jgi:hypothetical protein